MKWYIKSHRQTQENPVVCKDADHIGVRMYLLWNATHKNIDVMFQWKRRTLEPWQLITWRKVIARFLKINESKVQRVLKLFESEQQIEQHTTRQNRLITIKNRTLYQWSEQPNEQQLNNKWTTSEQQVNTNKNVRMKEWKNENKKETTTEVVEYVPRPITAEIDFFEKTCSDIAKQFWFVFKSDRRFTKHLISKKRNWTALELWFKDSLEFAVGVICASSKTRRAGKITSTKDIYYKYDKVLNEYKKWDGAGEVSQDYSSYFSS